MNCDYSFGNQCYNYYGNSGIKSTKYKIIAPEQSQNKQPGIESIMNPLPIFDNPKYKGSGKLKDKVAIITGGDSGLGRTAAIYYVKEGAKVVIPYYDEHDDANFTKKYIESLNGECLLISGDITDKNFSREIVDKTLKKPGLNHYISMLIMKKYNPKFSTSNDPVFISLITSIVLEQIVPGTSCSYSK